MFAAVVVLGNVLTHWLTEQLDFELRPSNEHIVHRIILASSAAYVLLMAIPFVPGVEIGLTLLMVLGPKIAVLVYVCTVAALSLSFVVGRLIPERVLIAFFRDLRFQRASSLLAQLQHLDAQQRLSFMLERAPSKFVPFLLRYRYVALLVAVNLPGNIVLGGGGGIAMMAGLSRLFAPFAFFVTVAVAVSPVPLTLLLFGKHFPGWAL
ncbi:MAG: hypothetical protein GWN84_19985 [Gammaproteobacteria bacterium]|nr:hypothetical protein [Gammaproteobacteria bacterium]NIR85102.1 hypothetical protein [Gammaproteobacteria bacterium]NIR92012.1 hypothetical protein [Gammaproteobacteria bacterium]NIU06151.1 hypothetical protein [Gammaproteobacteria bacterium]NIV53094.1 hypothetical protein [Gammaproteobacteria bacterium]